MSSRSKNLLLFCLRLLSTQPKSAGFTLIELLVSAVIGSIVVSGLLYLTTNLLQTDRQEAAGNQVQQDMQAALEYISDDLKEAAYVYSGECIQGRADNTTTTENEFCPGIVNHVPIPDNSVPVLAFWKLESLPPECQNTINQTPDPCADVRIANRTFSLIVYYLRRNQANEIWQGKARITRYALPQFTVPANTTTPQNTVGYVNPVQNSSQFRIWPYTTSTNGQLVNQQISVPTANGGTNPVLVDFVDVTRDADLGISRSSCIAKYGAEYEDTPNDTTLTQYGFGGVRSFYACVRKSQDNPDVIVSLRGNTHGRQGGTGNKFLPELQTQVLGRGILDRDPK